MRLVLRYGTEGALDFEVSDEKLVADCAAPRGVPVTNVRETMAAALAAPWQFPPLSRAVTPDDRIVLALDEGLPAVAEIVQPIVETLLACAVRPEQITVLQTAADAARLAPDPRGLLPPEIRAQVVLGLHDPFLKTELGYLASTESGRRIYFHRGMLEAEVVLPVARVRPDGVIGWQGGFSGLYPRFSDAEARQWFLGLTSQAPQPEGDLHLREELDEIGWLLGPPFSIQVIPGPDDTALHVLAGEQESLWKRARALAEQAWCFAIPQPVPLVIVGVTGAGSVGSWGDFGRALAAATEIVTEGGAIVICAELGANDDELPLGPGMQWLASSEHLGPALAQIQQHLPDDAIPALQLGRAQEKAKVYCCSAMEDSVLEDLSITPLHEGKELTRLAAKHSACVVLHHAQHIRVRIESPSSPTPK